MRGRKQILPIMVQAAILAFSAGVAAADFWQAPFDSSAADYRPTDSILSLEDALDLVAAENPSFRSFRHRIQAADENLKQAGLWSNPEIEIEVEEFGWDSPGFRESELTVSLSQEFELFGQRSARKKLAGAQVDAAELKARVSAFDLYLRTKARFYSLAHAQQEVMLNRKSVELSRDIVEHINHRLEKGAALRSELLLARLEERRAHLELDQAKQDVIALETNLVSLWKAKPTGARVAFMTEDGLDYLLEKITAMTKVIDSARDVIRMQDELNLLRAERNLAVAEARPSLTLSGGFKRFEADNSGAFLFGISLPIPFFDRNQGTRKSIDAQLHSMKYEIEQERNEIKSRMETLVIRLKQLKERHATLDTLLLPTARDAYQTLGSAYDAGRVPYTQLLEAKRILNELSFEHNDLILAIHQQIVEFESLTGRAFYIQKEN